jgi:hypothetical protein
MRQSNNIPTVKSLKSFQAKKGRELSGKIVKEAIKPVP